MAKKRKKKKVRIKIKNIIIFLMVILLMTSLIYYALKMPIKNIYITGNNILSDDIIINDAKLDNYPSFLMTSAKEIKNNLKSNIYISDVSIHKKLGNVIELEITEYTVIASIEDENKIILSSGNTVDNIYDVIDVPILVNNVDDDIYDNFIDKFSQIDLNILRQISEIYYSPVEVDDSRFLLYMNDGNQVYITLTKIDKLNKYNKIKDQMDGKKGIIYLDSGDYIELKDDSNDE